MKAARLSTVLDTAFAAVSSRGDRVSDGRQSRLRRPKRGRGDRRCDGECVDHRWVDIEEDAGSRGADQHCASEKRPEQDVLAAIAVREQAGERCEQRGGDQANEEDEADRSLTADPVGVHGNGDEICPVANDRRGPGELETPEALVLDDVAEGRRRVRDPTPHDVHAEEHPIPTCGSEGG